VDLLADERGRVDARLGGGPFNVARGLARLGLPTAFLGALSRDRFGELLRAALLADGVDLRCVVASDRPTTLALAELAGGSASYRFYTEGTAAPALSSAALPAEADTLHVGTLGLVLEPLASTLAELVAGSPQDTLVMVDPNLRPDLRGDPALLRRVLDRADVVKVSAEDLAELDPGAPVLDSARALLGSRTRCVLVTAGGEPGRVLTAHGDREIAVVPATVADTVGAGDAFCAGFLAAWRRAGHGITALGDPDIAAQAAAFAARVAAMTCERPGADPPRLDELPAESLR
jgi:fructokinase